MWSRICSSFQIDFLCCFLYTVLCLFVYFVFSHGSFRLFSSCEFECPFCIFLLSFSRWWAKAAKNVENHHFGPITHMMIESTQRHVDKYVDLVLLIIFTAWSFSLSVFAKKRNILKGNNSSIYRNCLHVSFVDLGLLIMFAFLNFWFFKIKGKRKLKNVKILIKGQWLKKGVVCAFFFNEMNYS